MIICTKCSKENQDHYKFCLGCGGELPREAGPKAFTPDPSQRASLAGMAAVSAPVSVAMPKNAACPQCGHSNPVGNVFCGACGFRISAVQAPAAAPPVATAPVVIAPPVAAASTGTSAIRLTALRPDGSVAGTYNMPPGTISVGRETGGVFAGDSYLSPKHATFRQTGGKLFVKDENSLNGVYKKLVRDVPVELRPADIFRIGQEIIRFEALRPELASAEGVERLGSPSKGYVGRITLLIGRETTGNAFPVPENGLQIGRERGDVLFPEDGYVSGLHCTIATNQGRVWLTDLGSSNGSFFRLREETEVGVGEILLMGQQLFRVDLLN